MENICPSCEERRGLRTQSTHWAGSARLSAPPDEALDAAWGQRKSHAMQLLTETHVGAACGRAGQRGRAARRVRAMGLSSSSSLSEIARRIVFSIACHYKPCDDALISDINTGRQWSERCGKSNVEGGKNVSGKNVEATRSHHAQDYQGGLVDLLVILALPQQDKGAACLSSEGVRAPCQDRASLECGCSALHAHRRRTRALGATCVLAGRPGGQARRVGGDLKC